jgi:histidine triad (HIT) family protein
VVVAILSRTLHGKDGEVMSVSDCVFCKIVDGEVPSHKVYEDENFYGFLDVNPRNKGHALIIPKDHHRWVWDMDGDRVADYYRAVNRVANAQREAFDTDWVVSMVIGDEVEHAHVWLVPRFEDDGHGGSIDIENVKEFSDEEMEEFARRIREALEER